MKKRIISFMLVLLMILTSAPVEAFGHQSRKTYPNKETEVKYNVVNINGQKYKAYKISDIMPENFEKKNSKNNNFNSVHMRSSGYVDQTDPDPERWWTLKINWETRDIDFPEGTIIFPVIYNPDGEEDTGDEIELGIFEVDAAHAKKGNTNERIKMKVKEGINPIDYIDGAEILCPKFIKYDIRIFKNNEWNGHEINQWQFLANVSQNVMPLYKISWFDNDSSKRQEFEGRWKGSKSIETDLVGSTEDGVYAVVDGYQGTWFYAGNKSDKPYTPVEDNLVENVKKGYKTKPIEEVSLNINDRTPVDTAGSYIRKDGVETQKGFLQLGTKYYYNITGDYRTLHEIELREELKVKFDPNGATFDQAVKTEQAIGHSMKIGESFGDLEAVTVPTKNQITNIPKKDNKDQEFVGWVDNEANKSLDFSNGQNADKLVKPNGYEVKKNVTFYAVYAPVAQGRVAVQYVDKSGTAIDDKYKIKDENYPKFAEGNKGENVEASKITEPKFIGYKRVEGEPGKIDVTGKTYKTEQIETVEVKYEKLPDIIPEKKNGQDNPDVTPEVKEHYAKVTFQVAAADAEKAKLQLDGADATSPLVYYVNPLEGKTIAEVASVKAVSKDDNLYKVDANDMWTYDPDTITGTNQVISQATDSDGNVVKTEITLTAKVADKTAAKFKDKLDPQDIKVWEKDPIDWKKGVKLKEANEELQKILDKTETKVTDESNRNSDAANLPNGQKGNLKVTFEDGSSIEIKDQTLYVAPHKNDNNTNLPEDAIKVDFKIGEGVNGEAKTEYVKPGTDVKENAPTVTLKEGFKEAKWYKGNAVATDADYKVTANVEFTAKATPKGQGSAQVEYHVGAKNITDKIADLKIDGQTYPANNKLTGTEDSAIDTTKITQPELIGYKKVNITTEPATDAKYTEAGTGKVIFNYEKIDDIIGPVKPGDKKPTGYVIVAFKAATGAELDPGETSYFVNPKAEIKAKISKVGDNYQISGKKADGTDLTGNVPAVTSTDENKYEIQYADGEAKKWAYDNFNKVGQDITTDTTFTAQVTKLGEPNVTFPPVEIEKGGSKVVTPEVKDKHNKKIEKPGKPEVNEKPDGVNVTPNDDGTVKIEVPKDYKGPGTFTIKVTYKIDGKDVPGVITVKIKEDKKPEPKPEPVPEVEIPGIKYKDHYTPTYPVYVSVPDKKVPVQDIFTHEQYIFGYPDDTIRPDGDMTRVEAIAVVARLQKLDLSDKTSNIYKDTKAGMWYNAAINAAFREGYLLEKEGENIRPNDKITRAELALLISHIDKKNDTVAPFEDVKGHKFEAAINQAYGNERIKGYPDGTFKPDNSITRAEVATMLNKLYDRYPDKNYIDANQNLVHNYKDMSYKGHWGYYELVEAYHTHKFARLANNMEEWKAIIK